MINLVESIDNQNIIYVDDWDTDVNPAPDDRIFRTICGEIILPISSFFGGGAQNQSLDYFYMNVKRSHNSDDIRNHICRYMNYFEKFYDKDKELLMNIYKIKVLIDYEKNYQKENFISDINRYIICNSSIIYKIKNMVADNYQMQLKSNNCKTPNLQFDNYHAKLLFEISMIMNAYIPLASHYMYVHNIRKTDDIKTFMLALFDRCQIRYRSIENVDIYNKIYECAENQTLKSVNTDKVLWEKNRIRGNDPITHSMDSVIDIILHIIPKYKFNQNILNFNYSSYRQSIRYGITDISYEYNFSAISSSIRDKDQNSEFDKYEARLSKRDESIAMQNKVTAEQAVAYIEKIYGTVSREELEHYRTKLTKNGSLINPLQKELLQYCYCRYFGDPLTFSAIHSRDDYIKLIVISKRLLLAMNMTILPYIISGRVVRVANRKILSKKDELRLKSSSLYQQVQNKYCNPKIEDYICDLIGTVNSSKFEIIEWDSENHRPHQHDGIEVPMIASIINEEMLIFISNI